MNTQEAKQKLHNLAFAKMNCKPDRPFNFRQHTSAPAFIGGEIIKEFKNDV